MWAVLVCCWAGNGFDKWGYAWKTDYTVGGTFIRISRAFIVHYFVNSSHCQATYLSLGYTGLSTKFAEFARSTTIGWHVCKGLTFLTFWIEVLCPTLSLFPGGELPAIRFFGALALAGMHVGFGVAFRLGSFVPAGIGCAILIMPTWFWDVVLPFTLKRLRVHGWASRARRSLLWLYVNRINLDSKYQVRIVATSPDTDDDRKVHGLLGLPEDTFLGGTRVLGKMLVVAVGLSVAFINYPRTYTFAIALGYAALAKAILVVVETLYSHWEASVRVFWTVMRYLRCALILVLSLSVFERDLKKWKNPSTGKMYINPFKTGLHEASHFFRLTPARGLFSDVGVNLGLGSSGWHIAAGIRGNNFSMVRPFIARTNMPAYSHDCVGIIHTPRTCFPDTSNRSKSFGRSRAAPAHSLPFTPAAPVCRFRAR